MIQMFICCELLTFATTILSAIPNTLSVSCKLTQLRCALLSFLIGKLTKTGSLFNSQFTVQFLTHMSLPYLKTKTYTVRDQRHITTTSMGGGGGLSLLLLHTTISFP